MSIKSYLIIRIVGLLYILFAVIRVVDVLLNTRYTPDGLSLTFVLSLNLAQAYIGLGIIDQKEWARWISVIAGFFIGLTWLLIFFLTAIANWPFVDWMLFLNGLWILIIVYYLNLPKVKNQFYK